MLLESYYSSYDKTVSLGKCLWCIAFCQHVWWS